MHEVGHRDPDSVLGTVAPQAVAVLDQWTTDVLADKSDVPPAQKVAAHRPEGFVDACYTSPSTKIIDMERCHEIFPIGTDARMVAGAPWANDILKCTLKPIDEGDYAQSLTDQQLDRLEQVFSEGVCDWTQPGVGQVPLAGTWAFYTGNAEVKYLRPAR